MSSRTICWLAACSLALLALGCEDQQYVSPTTVSLSITNLDTGEERVNRCNYVPVLLGSEVKARYAVEDDLKAVISLTRETVTVSFEGGSQLPDPWVVDSSEFEDKNSLEAETPPENYQVVLSSPCEIKEL
jgi:hypothetical protein